MYVCMYVCMCVYIYIYICTVCKGWKSLENPNKLGHPLRCFASSGLAGGGLSMSFDANNNITYNTYTTKLTT